MTSQLVNFTLILAPIQMRVGPIKKFDLHLLPLPLEVRDLLLELHSRLLLLVALVYRHPHLLLVTEVKVVVQIVVTPLPTVVRSLVRALRHLVQIGSYESAEVDCISGGLP
jgi:hypothetical protein